MKDSHAARRRIRIAIALGIVSVVAFACLIPWRTSPTVVWGDEGTFLAMSESLVREGDLRFDDRDRLRLEAVDSEDRGASTVILQRAKDGTYAYSKPLVYPIVSAPFVAVFGRYGPIALNLVLLGLALALAQADLVRRTDRGHAMLVLVTFVCAAAVLPYTLWRMSDIAQMAFVLVGLTLTLRPREAVDAADDAPRGWAHRLLAWRGGPYLGSALLGATIIMRVNNLALAAVPILAALFRRDLRGAVKTTTVIALSAGILFATSGFLTGALVPYSAARSSFNQQTGYPRSIETQANVDKPDGSAFETAIETRPATHRTGLVPSAGLDRTLYAAGYFLFGRHTGLIVYFPAALILAWAAIRRPDAAGTAALIGFAGSALFFLVWMPFNYFGGNTFIGNRYLLSAYPALLLAPRRLPGGRAMAVAWTIALVGYGSAMVSAWRVDEFDTSSQNHTRAGIFRALPYESVARDLSGKDRYWGELFVRFVDPLADVGPWWFTVRSDRSATEMLVAQWQPSGPLRFRVETDAPDAQLVVRDWRGRHTFPVGATGRSGLATVVDVDLAPPWRRHRFWWHLTQDYSARLIRVGLESPDGDPATARVRLLGVPELLESAFAYERRALDLPQAAIAGETGSIVLAVRNLGGRPWRPQSATPVFVRQRITRVDEIENDESSGAVAGPNVLLSETVVPGQTARIEVPITWPDAAGSYRVEIDLVLAHVGSFDSRLGTPLVDVEIEVSPTDATTQLGDS